MSQQNEAVARKLIEEGWNLGNLAVVDECLTADYEHEGPLDRVEGPAGEKSMITKYRTAFPDCHLRIDEVITSADRVVMRFTYTGTNRGPFEGMPATGRAVTGQGISVLRMRDGRIAGEHAQWDALGLMQQLGVVTLPGKAKTAGA